MRMIHVKLTVLNKKSRTLLKDGEEITYDDGPCCPRCKKVNTTCQLRTKTEFIRKDTCVSKEEIEYQYCGGSCGPSSSIPMLSFDDTGAPSLVCKFSLLHKITMSLYMRSFEYTFPFVFN